MVILHLRMITFLMAEESFIFRLEIKINFFLCNVTLTVSIEVILHFNRNNIEYYKIEKLCNFPM